MIVLDCPQGSDDWIQARLGIPTSSQFHRILTAGGRPSAQASGYIAELVAEWAIGEPVTDFFSLWAERGKELEDEAVSWYELERSLDTTPVGFCLTDSRAVGCSPDRLVGDDGGLEIKCRSAKNHVAALLAIPDEGHRLQVQGSLWVTGRRWWDLLFYHPRMRPIVVRAERDEAFIAKIDAALAEFCESLAKSKRYMEDHEYVIRDPREREPKAPRSLPSLADEFSRRLERARNEQEVAEVENLIRMSRGLDDGALLSLTVAAQRRRRELSR